MGFSLGIGGSKGSSKSTTQEKVDQTKSEDRAKTSISDILAEISSFSSQQTQANMTQQELVNASTLASTSAEEVTLGGNVFQDQYSFDSGQVTTQQAGDQLTVGGGTRVSNQVSPEAISSVLEQMLGGYKGLSAIAGGEKTAGLYDSTTKQLQTNDLLSRVVGEVAKLSTTQTSENLAQLVTRGADVTEVGSRVQTAGSSTINTPKVVTNRGISTQDQRTASSAVQGTQSATTSAEQQKQATSQKTAEEEAIDIAAHTEGTSSTKGKSKQAGFSLGL